MNYSLGGIDVDMLYVGLFGFWALSIVYTRNLKAGRHVGQECTFLISSFRRVLYVVCFLLGNTPASGVYMLTFRNTLSHLHRQVDVNKLGTAYENGTDGVFRNIGI